MKKLIILRGLPGSGKTTLAVFFEKFLEGAVTVAADDYFTDKEGNYNWFAAGTGAAHSWCQSQVDMHMSNSAGCIIVHNTSTTDKELLPYFVLAEKYGYEITSLIVENRHGNKNIHNVPGETMIKMKGRFSVQLG